MKTSFLLAINLMIKKLPMHCILIIQTAITVLLLAIIIGRIQVVSETAEITHTFAGSNAYYFMRYQYVDSTFDISDLLLQQGIHSFSLGEIGNLGFRYQSNKAISAIGYNDIIIDSCALKIKSGVWFTDYVCENVPAISIGSSFGVGEILNVSNSFDNSEYTLEVIGCIERDAYVISFNRSASRGASTVEHIISNPQVDLILPYSSNKYNSIQKTTNQEFDRVEKSLASLIIIESTHPIEYINEVLSKYGHTTYITDMLNNYDETVKFEMLVYLVVCVVFTLLTLVGLGGNNGIQNMLNEHQYIIYFMLGATQRKCVCIEAMRASTLILVSFALAILASLLIPSVFSAHSPKGYLSMWAIILLYLVMVFFITSGTFLYKLGRRNLAAKYRENA